MKCWLREPLLGALMIRTRLFLVSVLFTGLTVAACRREVPPPPPPAPAPAAQAPAGPNLDSLRAYEDSVRRAQAATAAAEADRQAAIARNRETLGQRVQFEYDQSALTPAALQILNQKLPILRASTQVQLRMEGHADEQGSNEYNLALGNRRAQSVMDFLTQNGIAANRLQITSFGEERPLEAASTEAAWAQNRRVEFVITAGANAIQP
ncbi:MAG: peptidoglycan-associated lipoprotein [Gemmatimonadetes bacterium]|nr:peptidoglycan-associated lipoprotein [Gemmatimonadota bacterium]